MLALFLASLLVPSPAPAQGSRKAEVRGRVTDDAGAPLTEARLVLRRAADDVVVGSTLSSTDGAFRLSDVAPGRYRLGVQRIGYETRSVDIELAPGDVRVLDLQLVSAPIAVEGFVVDARNTPRERARFESEAGVTARVVTAGELKALPGLAEADVLRAVEVLPGVVSTSDFSSAFNVRGGSTDQNLILLDGFPIFNPFHLGGLFSVFNSDVLARAELLSGGFGAEYGGRVSSVLQVETRDYGGEEFGGEVGMSLLASRVSLHGSLPAGAGMLRGGWFLSARRSYFDKLLPPDVGLPYHLVDLQGGLTLPMPGGGQLRLTAYTGDDVLDMSKRDPERSDGGEGENDEGEVLRVKWGWGNDVVGIRWDQPLGEWLSTVRLGYSRYAEHFGLVDFAGQTYESRLEQLSGRGDLGREFSSGLSLQLGAELSRLRSLNLAEGGGSTFWEQEDRGTLGGAYAQLRWRPTEAWIVEPGVRLDAWAASDTTFLRLAPRLAVKRFLGAKHEAAIKLAAGRYTQFLHSLRDETLPFSNEVWVVAGRHLPAVTSDQAQLGVERFWGESWSASAEVYLRRFRGLVTYNDADDLNTPSDDYLQGEGRSYGLDLQVRKHTGRWTGWTTISLLKAERRFPDPLAVGWEDVPPEITYPPGFDRRVDIDLVLRYAPRPHTEIGLRWAFGSGLPYTRPVAQHVNWEYDPSTGRHRLPIPTGSEEPEAPPMFVVLGPRNGARYPAYHRLDLSLRRTFQRRWGTVTPYLQVLNVYNRKNPLFYFYDYSESPATRSGISMFPVLPTIGVEVTF